MVEQPEGTLQRTLAHGGPPVLRRLKHVGVALVHDGEHLVRVRVRDRGRDRDRVRDRGRVRVRVRGRDRVRVRVWVRVRVRVRVRVGAGTMLRRNQLPTISKVAK